MAGRGAAPRDRGNRRRYNQPARGEWVDLKPLKKPILPRYLKGMTVSRSMWQAWREDPVTGQYGPADIATLIELGMVYAKLKDNEQRLRMDGLGLTPKGKRDLRWRTPAEQDQLAEVTPIKRLRVTAKD